MSAATKDRVSYSIEEAAANTGYSVNTIRTAIRSGALVARYPTAKAVIPAAELHRWINDAPTAAERTP